MDSYIEPLKRNMNIVIISSTNAETCEFWINTDPEVGRAKKEKPHTQKQFFINYKSLVYSRCPCMIA